MTIIEKFEQLSPEQQQQTLLLIQKQGLDTFLAEVGRDLSSEEKATAQDYFMAQKVELTDEEVEAITGGSYFQKCPKGHYEIYFHILPGIDCRLYCKFFEFVDKDGAYDKKNMWTEPKVCCHFFAAYHGG